MKSKRKFYFFGFFFVSIFFFGRAFYLSINPTYPSKKEPTRFYSNQQKDDLRWILYKAIQRAKSSIHLVMFGLNEPSLLHILSQKAKSIPVTIYYDAKNSPSLEKLLPHVKAYPIHKSGFMHQKILIIDESLVFLGSANFTPSSLIMHDNLIIGLFNSKIAKFIIDKSPHSQGHIDLLQGGQKIDFWLLPDPRGNGLHAIFKILRQAKKSIKIAIFTFTHPSIVEELIMAKKRGVDVAVTIDFSASLGISAKSMKKLRQNQIPVLVSQGGHLLHHKFILIDDCILLTGSANLTKAAFYKNHDCFLIFHNLQENQKKFMKKLWKIIINESR